MRTLAILAVWGLAAAGVQAQTAPDYVLVSPVAGPPPGRAPRDSVVYWNTAEVVRHGDDIEVALRFVSPGLGETRPRSSTQRFRLSCDWAAGSFVDRSREGDNSWSTPRFIDAGPLESMFNQACGFVATPAIAPRFPSEDAVYEDGVKRLGFESLEAAMQLPEASPYITSGPFYTAAPTGGDHERYDLVYGPDDHQRAVFLKGPALAGSVVEGRSIWLMGVGGPADNRAYALRDFRADCAARTIAVASVRRWPMYGSSGEPGADAKGPAALSSLPPIEGRASAALLAAACSAPGDGVVAASVNEVVAFAETPSEDPAFAVLSQQTIPHDDMRWTRIPDAAAVTAAYPPDALRPGETGLSTVSCVVTREYALSACRPSYHSPPDRGLSEAHMALIGQYAPERASVTGADTLGRRVELSIRWSPEGSASEPRQIPPADMVWRRTPSRTEVQRVWRGPGPATAIMTCDITDAHRLANCTDLSWMGANGRSFSAAIRSLSHVFEAAPTTRSGEPTAGRKTMVLVRAE
jgi:hypothetical protein